MENQEFLEKYRKIAKEKHIKLGIHSLKFFGLSSLQELIVKYNQDPSLNNISLVLFDSMTNSYNYYNKNKMLLADGICVYKTLLIDLISSEEAKLCLAADKILGQPIYGADQKRFE